MIFCMHPDDQKTFDETPLFTRGKVIHELWERALPIAGRNPNQWRTDRAGVTIHRACYMNPKSPFGWKVEMSINKDGITELHPVHYTAALIT